MTANKTERERETKKMKSPVFNLILCQILNAMVWIVLRLMSANDVYLQQSSSKLTSSRQRDSEHVNRNNLWLRSLELNRRATQTTFWVQSIFVMPNVNFSRHWCDGACACEHPMPYRDIEISNLLTFILFNAKMRRIKYFLISIMCRITEDKERTKRWEATSIYNHDEST